jgi:hypothetical protein
MKPELDEFDSRERPPDDKGRHPQRQHPNNAAKHYLTRCN